VYYGSDTAKEIFNPKAFIHCSDFPNFDAVVEYIKELDQDDEKYLEMLCQPIFKQDDVPMQFYRALENYLLYIFNQPLNSAYRRSKVFRAEMHEKYLIETIPNVKYRVIELTNAYYEYQLSGDVNKKHNEIRAIRSEVRQILKGYAAVYTFENSYYLYEIAYPIRMYIYCICKGLSNKIKKIIKR